LFQGVAARHEGSSETTWERGRPYLLASVGRLLPEARKQGRLPSQGIFARLWRALTERGETAVPDLHLSFVNGHLPSVICQRLQTPMTNDEWQMTNDK
jgi:hypothetical protein